MLKGLPDIFTDRREALALFECIRGHDPSKPWPLLPLLAFIGPSGSGKSMLIEHLRNSVCCFEDGRTAIPHAFLDFTLSSTPKGPLDILIALRNQLQGQADANGKHLTFPRFDLGASIAAAFTHGNTLPLLDEKLEQSLTQAQQLFGTLADIGSSLGSIFPVIPPLVSGLKLAGSVMKMAAFPPLQAIIKRLESGSGWKWYREHGSDTGLQAAAGVDKVLLRLYAMSIPGTNEREKLIQELLPAAFLDDLCHALTGPNACWSRTVNVIIFLDGYEELLKPGELGRQLLELLVCSERRRRGEHDPLLVVIGSKDRLRVQTDNVQPNEQDLPFEQCALLTKEEAEYWAQTRYHEVAQRLPSEPSVLRVDDLYIPIVLLDFGIDDTRNLLSQLAKKRQAQLIKERGLDLQGIFAGQLGEELVQAIQSETQGHPLYITLAAEALFEAKIRGKPLKPDEFDRMSVSPKRSPSSQTTDEYLLALFLHQLSEEEHKQLISCAVPRYLDIEILKILVQLSPYDAQKRWKRYRDYTFFGIRDEDRLVLHPVVRHLLLNRLLPEDYGNFHTCLRVHFSHKAHKEARIEEAYHALALGDPGPAIEFGIEAQRSNITLWLSLLEAVSQAPIERLSEGMIEVANAALQSHTQDPTTEARVRAIILGTWLTASQGDMQRPTQLQSSLERAILNDSTLNLRNIPPGIELSPHIRRKKTRFMPHLFLGSS